MKHLDEIYRELIRPENFITNFNHMDDFKDWLRLGIINDCKSCLKVFEEAEMYEHCRAIQDVIDEKVDRILGGLGFIVD